MFISIALQDSKTENGYTTLNYLLEDTLFRANLSIPIEDDIWRQRGDASVIPSGLIFMYEKYNQNVPRNLALFYSQTMPTAPLIEKKKFIQLDQMWSDIYTPAAMFGAKYYRCVLNQLDVLNYVGKLKNV